MPCLPKPHIATLLAGHPYRSAELSGSGHLDEHHLHHFCLFRLHHANAVDWEWVGRGNSELEMRRVYTASGALQRTACAGVKAENLGQHHLLGLFSSEKESKEEKK